MQTLSFAQEWRHVSSVPDSSGSFGFLLSNSTDIYTVSNFFPDMVINKSTNNGENWEKVFRINTYSEYGISNNVWSAQLVDEKYFYLTFQDNAKILKSTDGGETFELIEFDSYLETGFFNLAMYDYKTGVAMEGDHIYITRDGWETYDSVNRYAVIMHNPEFIDENTVQFINPRRNSSTKIVNFDIKTQTWKEHFDFEGFTKDIFVNSDYTENGNVFLAGYRRNGNGDFEIMYKSTDFGKSWFKKIDKKNSLGFGRVLFNDTLNGFAVGQYNKVMMTNDAGENWNYVKDIDFFKGSDIDTHRGSELTWLNDKPYFLSHNGELYTTDSDFFDLYERYAISGVVSNEGIPITVPFKIGNRLIRPQPDATYRYTKRPKGDYVLDFKPSHYFNLKDNNNNIISVDDKDVIRNLEVIRQKYDIQFEVNNTDNKDISDVKFKIEIETNEGKYYVIDTLITYDEIYSSSIKELIANDIVKITPVIPDESDFVLIPSKLSIDFRQDTTLYFDVLDENNYSISGRITQLDKPMKYITVTLIQDVENYKFGATDSIGNYRFYNVDEGDYSIFITSEHYANDIYFPRYYDLKVDEHKEGYNFNYRPNSEKQFTGRVTDKQGNGIKDVRIQRFEFPSSLFSNDNYGVRTNSDGYYSSPYIGKDFDYEDLELGFYPVTEASYSPKFQYPVSRKSLDGYDFVIDTIVTSVPYRLPNMVTVYPNPVKTTLNIESFEKERLDIYDINGKRVLSIHRNSQQIDVSVLRNGVYFIKDSDGNHLSQFIKK